MHFYQFHIGDYKSHTHHLSPLEDLAYRRLLDHYYLHEEPIRQHEIARQIGMRDHEQDVLTVLDEFFVSTPAGYINPRADNEIAKYRKLSEDGKRGAAKRWAKTEAQPDQKGGHREAIALPSATPIATNNQEPITKKQINTKTPEGVCDLVWNDFKKLREKHKAPITETALKGLKREADKAKLSLEQVMSICCERGWRGFKADWAIQEEQKAKELPLGTDQQIEEAYRVECGGDPRQARFNSYFEMKKFILDQRDKRKVA